MVVKLVEFSCSVHLDLVSSWWFICMGNFHGVHLVCVSSQDFGCFFRLRLLDFARLIMFFVVWQGVTSGIGIAAPLNQSWFHAEFVSLTSSPSPWCSGSELSHLTFETGHGTNAMHASTEKLPVNGVDRCQFHFPWTKHVSSMRA